MFQRLVIILAALAAAGLIPTSSSAAESTTTIKTSDTNSAPNPADIHITSATWKFIPGVEVLNTTHFINIPQAQSLLNQHAEELLDCYAPTDYITDGSLTVHLYIGPTGVPVGIRGDTTGIAPLQARCMLKQAWLYEFSAPPTNEEQASVKYNIFFPTERTYSTPIAQNRPNMIIENVRATPTKTSPQESSESSETIPIDTLTQQLLQHSDDLRFCQTLALQETPHDQLVTDTEIRFQKYGTVFRPHNTDLVVTNQTTNAIPSNTVTDCIRRAISNWEITLPPTSTADFSTRFFITFQPPQVS